MTEAPSKDLRTNIQLSKKTIDILRNFSTINKSILIKTGKWVETMSVNKNIIAMTQVSEAFPEDMAIYDLPLFLGALSLFKKPWLNFPDDKKVIIYDEDTQGKTVFYYSDPEIIVTPPDFNTNLPDVELMFDLPHTDINQLLQAAKVYGVEDLCVNGYQGEYSICVRDNKNKTSNVFSLPLKKVLFEQAPREGDEDQKPYKLTPERQTFCYCFKVENLKLLDAGYHVTISNKNIANFGSLSHSDLNYFIALEP
tara:strand:- start:129 stop:887 length:759 start_codon:yes stop_codon:yes gene_type:complete